MYDYGLVIICSWLVFFAVWIVGAFGAKRDVSGSGILSSFWLWRIVLVLIAVILLQAIGVGTNITDLILFESGVVLGWIAAALTIAGIAFAIWARFYLGRNWSSHPTHKKDHELVTGGPYAYVRHPIYTGMILALLGSSLTGSIFAIVLFVIMTIVFSLRIGREEGIMLGLFPEAYPAYQAKTKRLVPFVW